MHTLGVSPDSFQLVVVKAACMMHDAFTILAVDAAVPLIVYPVTKCC